MPTWAVEHNEATFRTSLLLYDDKKASTCTMTRRLDMYDGKKASTMSNSANVMPSH